MATNPSTLPENAGRITAPDASYPYGSAKDDSTGTTGDGTPIKKALLNDTYGIIQAVLTAANIVPSGNAETAEVSQVLDGLRKLSFADNRLKGNQNWTLPGADGTLTGVNQTFNDGDEFSAGRVVVGGADLVNAKVVTGVFSADSGTYRVTVPGEFPDDYFGVRLPDGNNYTGAGVSITAAGGVTYIDVDNSAVPDHLFPGISEQVASWPIISDDESAIAYGVRNALDVTGSRTANVWYPNDSPAEMNVFVAYAANPGLARFSFDLRAPDGTVVSAGTGTESGTASISANISVPVPKGWEYRISGSVVSISGTLSSVIETRF